MNGGRLWPLPRPKRRAASPPVPALRGWPMNQPSADLFFLPRQAWPAAFAARSVRYRRGLQTLEPSVPRSSVTTVRRGVLLCGTMVLLMPMLWRISTRATSCRLCEMVPTRFAPDFRPVPHGRHRRVDLYWRRSQRHFAIIRCVSKDGGRSALVRPRCTNRNTDRDLFLETGRPRERCCLGGRR